MESREDVYRFAAGPIAVLTAALLLAAVAPARAANLADPALIEQGRRLFFEETFGGNGRTCGTCHREERNFTIDAAFIAGLPPDDPLFVAETNPALRRNFEVPELMRRFGLILENTYGFDDLANTSPCAACRTRWPCRRPSTAPPDPAPAGPAPVRRTTVRCARSPPAPSSSTSPARSTAAPVS